MWCECMTGLISLVKCRIYCSPFDRKWNKKEMILVPGVGLVQQDTASCSEKWMPGSRAYVLLFAQSGWRCYARYYSLGARRVKKQYWVSPLAAWHAFVFEHLFHVQMDFHSSHSFNCFQISGNSLLFCSMQVVDSQGVLSVDSVCHVVNTFTVWQSDL